jgi:hypothetical protein
VADAGGLGTIEIKAMKDHGYPVEFAVGITAASSTLGPIIPPSLPMVIYGVQANTSIGKLFAAGFVPGALMALFMMGMVAYYAHTRGYGADIAFSWPRMGRAFGELGAIIVALGHEYAGFFSNDDALAGAFLKAAEAEGEGAWRMPMGQAYDDKLKSRIADMMNVGGREGGAITAAQFLARFIKPDVPWVHLDIAGTALVKADLTLSPKGATGWGVMALNRLIADRYETH